MLNKLGLHVVSAIDQVYEILLLGTSLLHIYLPMPYEELIDDLQIMGVKFLSLPGLPLVFGVYC